MQAVSNMGTAAHRWVRTRQRTKDLMAEPAEATSARTLSLDPPDFPDPARPREFRRGRLEQDDCRWCPPPPPALSSRMGSSIESSRRRASSSQKLCKAMRRAASAAAHKRRDRTRVAKRRAHAWTATAGHATQTAGPRTKITAGRKRVHLSFSASPSAVAIARDAFPSATPRQETGGDSFLRMTWTMTSKRFFFSNQGALLL